MWGAMAADCGRHGTLVIELAPLCESTSHFRNFANRSRASRIWSTLIPE